MRVPHFLELALPGIQTNVTLMALAHPYLQAAPQSRTDLVYISVLVDIGENHDFYGLQSPP